MNKTKNSKMDISQQENNMKPNQVEISGAPGTGKKNEKEKRRNNEKRKEKSRDAARTRRSRETEIFNELAAAVPMKPEDIEHLDKASVMRLAIAFLKSRGMISFFPQLKDVSNEEKTPSADDKDEDPKMSSDELEEEHATLKSLDGFLLVLSVDGDITYVSENIADHLGLTQIDLLGQPIWDYCHQCDHDELREALNGRKTSPSELLNGVSKGDCLPLIKRDFFLRLKCTLTSRGRSVNIKSASYKVIHVTGHMVTNDELKPQLLAIAQPLPHPSNIEIPMGSTTFLTKHALDMKFSYVDDKMLSVLGYKPEHLIGKSLYDCHHGADSEGLMTTFKSLISKGQTETSRYRFLARCGGYSWLVTQATIVYDKQKPQSVVCVNYIISGIENKDEIYSCAQLAALESEKQQSPIIVDDIVKKETKPAIDEQLSIEVKEVVSPKTVIRTAISPPIISGIPININSVNFNTNIRRPRSVTAAIFASAQAAPSETNTVVSATNVVSAASTTTNSTQQPQIRGQSVTAKLFAASPSLSSLSQQRPQNATSKIFVPRTEDMNKGYYMYCEEDTGLTMLKDEPDDLTHLAPTAGDACISIDETTPFFSDMFDDFIIPDHYNTLLSDEINSLNASGNKINSNTKQQNNNNNSSNNNNNSTSNNNNNNNSSTNNNNNYRSNNNNNSNNNNKSCENNNGSSDPFINYRDDSCDINNSPHLLSPGLSKSPEGSTSLPSLCSPNGSLPEDDFAFMTLNMDDDIDLSMRAPYIPMSEGDDLPLLISDDLMWGAQPDEIKEAISQIKMNNKGNTNVPVEVHQIRENKGDSNFNNINSKTIDSSSLAALLSGNSMFTQPQQNKPPNHSHNGSSITHHLLMQHQQQQQDTGRQHEIQVHHIQIQNQQPLQQQQQQQQQQLHDLIEEIKPKLSDRSGGIRQTSNSNNNNNEDNRDNLNGGVVNPLVMIGQAYKNNQLNQMEHTWTMNDLLQLNLNTNEAIHQQSPQISPVPIKLERSTNNKRPSNIFNIDMNNSASKRLKSTLLVSTSTTPATTIIRETKTSPHLLQQLMAPLTQAQRAKLKGRSVQNDSSWNLGGNSAMGAANGANNNQSQGNAHQPSNSVLMNLLVSGCDETISLEPPDAIMQDDNSRDSIRDNCLTPSSMDNSDSSNVLLHHDNSNQFLANPMIGGINATGPVSPSLLTLSDMELWRAIQQRRQMGLQNGAGGVTTAGMNVNNLMMDLNEQDYTMGLNTDLLAALDVVVTAPSPTMMT